MADRGVSEGRRVENSGRELCWGVKLDLRVVVKRGWKERLRRMGFRVKMGPTFGAMILRRGRRKDNDSSLRRFLSWAIFELGL